MKLQDKAALVTGGARRLGRAVALELARAGCNVAIHYHTSSAQAAAVAAEIRAMHRQAVTVQADLADLHAPKRILEEVLGVLGRLDVLVNNAAVFEPDAPDSIDIEKSLRQLRINLIAPMLLCGACWGELRRHGSGKIVNIADARTDLPMKDYLTYTVAKAGLVGLTRALARSMAPHVQVNAVAPGIVEFSDDARRLGTARPQALGRVPAGRPARAEDVARAVRFLVEEGHYVTGQVWMIDGGRSLV